MGKITQTAIAIMVSFFVLGVFSNGLYTGSTDENKTAFVRYGQYESLSGIDANISGANTNSSISNLQHMSNVMMQKITDAQSDLKSDNPAEQILGAFGLISALTIDVIFLLIGVLLDGANFVWGISANLSLLPPPWSYFGILASFMAALFIVFMALRIISIIFKWDV